MTSWTEHTGAVMNLEYMPGDDNRLVSVSNYGEILLNQRQGDRLLTKVLLKNSDYDFRDVIISKTGRIYAVSRTGHLAIIQEDLKTVKIIDLDKIEHPMRLHDISDNNLLIIGENSMGLFDMKRNIIRGTRALGFHVIKGSRKSGLPLLFDNQGKMHLVSGLDNMKTEDVPVTGTVTAHCESKNTGIEAYGMSDGTIWLIQKDGKKQKLLGHRSRISKMKLNGRRLFSSSYDGKVNLWITDKEKIEPMTLIETKNWIMHFNFDSTKTTFWMGDAKGGLTAVNISVPIMVNSVKQKLTRNLTADEWNYFIGQSVPYESFIVKSE
jgi:WD40 repeat protein